MHDSFVKGVYGQSFVNGLYFFDQVRYFVVGNFMHQAKTIDCPERFHSP